ncbi:MAG: hypothetical protein RR359_04955, partial [Bacilli bacterium]
NYAKFTAQEYWLMNACGEADTYHNPDFLIISDVGTVNPRSNFGFVMRPVFFFKSDTIIASGNGTPDSPYTLQ